MLEKIARTMAVLPVLGFFFPFRCKNCGAILTKLNVDSLSKEEQKQLGKDAWIVERYAYKCNECDQHYLVA